MGGRSRGLIKILILILASSPLSCNMDSMEVISDSDDDGAGITQETEEQTDFVEEADDVEETEDAEEAFSDLEEESSLCSDYISQPREKRLPDAIIMGVRKGGTRALLEFINMHPRVMRAKQEIHFFDKHWSKGLEWYISQMPAVLRGQISMEKTPGYFHESGVPLKIFQTNNATKLVLIVRNPVDRLVSDYNQFRSRNIDRGVDYPSLESFLFTPSGHIDISYQPLQRSIYHYHLVRWMRYFSLDQIHIVDGDRFIKEPWVGLAKLEKFLELPPHITRDNFYFNETKGFFCGMQTMSLATLSPHSWTCTRKTCLSKSKGRPKPPVDPETYRKLYRFFLSHNQIFFSLIQRYDFDWAEKREEDEEDMQGDT